MTTRYSSISYSKNKPPYLLSFAFLLLSLVMTQCGIAQISKPAGLCENPEFDKEVAKWIRQSVPVVGAEELYEEIHSGKGPAYILDARDAKEYNVSHLPGAVRVGYDDFNKGEVAQIPKDAEVVIYCSIGYRSEKIGEKLKKMGFKNVRNLYGSIFDWANRDLPLVDNKGKKTKKIHTYNKDWGRWVQEKHAQRVW